MWGCGEQEETGEGKHTLGGKECACEKWNVGAKSTHSGATVQVQVMALPLTAWARLLNTSVSSSLQWDDSDNRVIGKIA